MLFVGCYPRFLIPNYLTMSKKCLRCKKPQNTEYKLCHNCRAMARRRTVRRRTNGICTFCGKNPPRPGFMICPICSEKKKIYKRTRTQREKDLVFAAYGGYRCNCCGETEPKFLSIDHINNDGAEHKRQLNLTKNKHRNDRTNGSNWYQTIIRLGFPPIFQILCMNCNCGKHRNGGVCPHKTKIVVRVIEK